MAITIDAAAPATNPATELAQGTTTTLVTGSFTPPANSLLVVTAAIGYEGSTTDSGLFSISDSLGGTWPASASADAIEAPTSGGVPQVMINSRFITTSAAMTVTLTTGTAKKGKQLTVYVLDGTATTGWKGAHNASTAGLAESITTTTTGSQVIVVACLDSNATLTADTAATTTKANSTDPSSQDALQLLTGYATATTTTPGATTLGWKGATGTYAWAAVEYLPLISGSPRPIQVISTAISGASSY